MKIVLLISMNLIEGAPVGIHGSGILLFMVDNRVGGH